MSEIEQPFVNLPTGKPHVSFSEIKSWEECSFRHKLQHVLKINLFVPGVHMDFGTAIHAACENFLKSGTMNVDIFVDKLTSLWSEHKSQNESDFTDESFEQFKKEGLAILPEIPVWMNSTFPNWEFVDAEHYLYERIEKYPDHAFKGFIDCIIKVPGPKKTPLYWLLDFKTTSWGWGIDKKTDPSVQGQLVLYKNYWSKKMGVDPKSVRCGFVLLKRTAKQDNHCELVKVSVGDVTNKKHLKVVGNMVASVKRGIAMKNKNSCKFCDYKDTEHCP